MPCGVRAAAKDGPLVVETGKHTGRSANDRFVVRNSTSERTVWWGKSNKPMDAEAFDRLHQDFLEALGAKDKLFVSDLFGGSQPEHRVRVRVVNELAWHNVLRPCWSVGGDELSDFAPKLIIDLQLKATRMPRLAQRARHCGHLEKDSS